MFEGLRARLDQLLAEQTTRPDARVHAASLQAALIEAKVAVGTLRDALTVTERELAGERQRLEDAERRGRLAAEVPDAETVEIASRFAVKHRERVAVLERKLSAQRDELTLMEHELEEMAAQFRAARPGGPGGGGGTTPARPDLESAGGWRAGYDHESEVLRGQLDRATREAAAEAQLAQLKKKLGKQK